MLYSSSKSIKNAGSIICKKKQKLIDEFEIALKEKAIDCNLFYNRNNYKGEKPLKCGN